LCSSNRESIVPAPRHEFSRRARGLCSAAALSLLAAVPAQAPHPLGLAYRIAMPDPAAHYFEIELRITGIHTDSLDLQLPVWSPGRYARMDFARNLQRFAAADSAGKPIVIQELNGSRWRLRTHGQGNARITYRIFANTLSGTFSVLDTAHANWNGASLFVYVDGHKADPVHLSITAPSGWRVMNGAAANFEQREFDFPNYDELIDTPTEVAPAISLDSFTADGRLYRVMLHHNGPLDSALRMRFVRGIEKIVKQENLVIAPPPLAMYTFVGNAGYEGSDGMEHLYSTQIITPHALTDTAAVDDFLGYASHEYFHVWNVKRIRPELLGPFDYTSERYEPSLWVAEGWTEYYGILTLERTGITTPSQFFETLGEDITYDLTRPARTWISARESSMRAPFFDGAPEPMAVDEPSDFISYYTKGEGLALLIDLEIRARTNDGRSLDDALRALKRRSWDAPRASYYLQGRGYTELDVEKAVSEAAGTDLHDWFARYVGGTEEPPFAEALAKVGLTLTMTGDSTNRKYTVAPASGVTKEQLERRAKWMGLTGKATEQ
jgi:predicted metalloprotease with PDZ domain